LEEFVLSVIKRWEIEEKGGEQKMKEEDLLYELLEGQFA